METVIWAASGGAVAALLLVALVAGLRRRPRPRDLDVMLAAAQREADDLRTQLDELTAPAPLPVPTSGPELQAYLITDAGIRADESAIEPTVVPDRLVLSATLGVPVVKVAAFGHGIRRALSAESRNRIWFEMRREVRAARKRRRRLVKQHLRDLRAEERSAGLSSEGLG